MHFDQEANQQLQSSLLKGENIIWAGRPKQGIYLMSSDMLGIPFSLLWGGFSFFWFFNVLAIGAPFFFLIFGSVFSIIGLYFIFGRFIATSRRRAKTFYAITNKRALIKSSGFSTAVKSIDLKSLSHIETEEFSNGETSIYFGSKPGLTAIQGMPRQNFSAPVPTFERLSDGMLVYEVLSDVKEKL